MKTRKIGLANYLAYGSGDFLGAGTTALTAAWLLYFYTTFCGLTPIEATFIFAAARVLDAVVSPLMGFLTDNFGTTWLGKRFGRRKFFILLGIPCVFSYSLMWVGDMSFWYYLLTYLIFDIVYTMIHGAIRNAGAGDDGRFQTENQILRGAYLYGADVRYSGFLPPGDPAHAFRQRQRDLLLLCKPGLLRTLRTDAYVRLVLYTGAPAGRVV